MTNKEQVEQLKSEGKEENEIQDEEKDEKTDQEKKEDQDPNQEENQDQEQDQKVKQEDEDEQERLRLLESNTSCEHQSEREKMEKGSQAEDDQEKNGTCSVPHLCSLSFSDVQIKRCTALDLFLQMVEIISRDHNLLESCTSHDVTAEIVPQTRFSLTHGEQVSSITSLTMSYISH